MQDWEPDWKIPTEGDMTSQYGNTEAIRCTNVEMDPPENGEEDTNQGNGTKDAPETEPTEQPPLPPPKTWRKWKDQRTGSAARKKTKDQKTPTVYTLTKDDMEKNFYQLRDVAE